MTASPTMDWVEPKVLGGDSNASSGTITLSFGALSLIENPDGMRSLRACEMASTGVEISSRGVSHALSCVTEFG